MDEFGPGDARTSARGAWLSWVVARHGGWNCYGKPPGPKTMAKGWERFRATLAGFVIARADAVV